MRKIFPVSMILLLWVLALAAQRKPDRAWQSDFRLDPDDLATIGRNPYLILEPGYVLVLEAGNEQLKVTVLDETRKIENIETRIVEERETKNGQLVEISRNFFAISRRTNDVFYCGEDVDLYKAGKVVNHEGAWMAGVSGARCGLMMPGSPTLHARYYQEIAPGVAMDRAEVVSLSATLKTPAGTFKDVLKIVETTPLERGSEAKYFAREVGLLQDGSLKLVKYGKL